MWLSSYSFITLGGIYSKRGWETVDFIVSSNVERFKNCCSVFTSNGISQLKEYVALAKLPHLEYKPSCSQIKIKICRVSQSIREPFTPNRTNWLAHQRTPFWRITQINPIQPVRVSVTFSHISKFKPMSLESSVLRVVSSDVCPALMLILDARCSEQHLRLFIWNVFEEKIVIGTDWARVKTFFLIAIKFIFLSRDMRRCRCPSPDWDEPSSCSVRFTCSSWILPLSCDILDPLEELCVMLIGTKS